MNLFHVFYYHHSSPGTTKISKAVTGVHEGGVFSLCAMKDGSILSAGGKDRKIIQWDPDFQKTGLETEVVEYCSNSRFL